MFIAVNQLKTLLAAGPGPGPRCLPILAILLGWLIGLGGTRAGAAVSFQDDFANRELLTDTSGTIDGDSRNASRESNEPRHGDKPGGRSLWISWIAPADGVATFWTDGSNFDTLLSAYYFGSTNDTTLDKLKEAAKNDDDPTRAPTSLIQFGARAGVRYEIAVDGYRGASGDVRLRWDFESVTSAPPVIVSIPQDQAGQIGDTVVLSVNMEITPNLDLQWRYNGNSFGANDPVLVLSNLQATNAGRYTLRIRIDDVRYETAPIEIQINSEGQTNALARDKWIDALETPLLGDDGSAPLAGRAKRGAKTTGVVRGYNGSQIFNTTYATADPAEPAHCGLAATASYWFAYQAPTNGTLLLDTAGTTFDNVIAAYTYTNAVSSYADLLPITCDHLGLGGTTSRLEFAVLKGRQYLLVFAGVNGSKGFGHLNYQLDVLRPPLAPAVSNIPPLQFFAAGTNVTLAPEILGSAPLHFVWRREGSATNLATNAFLLLPAVSPPDSGRYTVQIWNHIGGPLEVSYPLRVVVPPRWDFSAGAEGGRFTFQTVTGQIYHLEFAPSVNGPWLPWAEAIPGDGGLVSLTNQPEAGSRFYRVRIE